MTYAPLPFSTVPKQPVGATEILGAVTKMPDADDDMVLELVFAAGCRYIVTHNVRDFDGSERLGVSSIAPRDFLNLIRTQS